VKLSDELVSSGPLGIDSLSGSGRDARTHQETTPVFEIIQCKGTRLSNAKEEASWKQHRAAEALAVGIVRKDNSVFQEARMAELFGVALVVSSLSRLDETSVQTWNSECFRLRISAFSEFD
jgi:hypothetical protein